MGGPAGDNKGKRIMKLYVGCLYMIVGIAMLTGCGLKTQSGDFTSGNQGVEEISFDEEPSVVLVYLPGGKGICTGTIVGLKAVLTAAHCVKGMTGRFEIKGKMGRFSTYNAEFRDYAGAGTVDDIGDFAMLRFDMTIAAPEHIAIIGSKVSDRDPVKAAGLGCNNIETRTGSGVLRRLLTTLYSADEDKFLSLHELYSAGDGGRGTRGIMKAGTCFGDSGGPLWNKTANGWRLIGATHAGGKLDSYEVSYFSNLIRTENNAYLHELNDTYSLGMRFD